MLSAFISSLRTVDLRRKILFTLGIVLLYRVGAALPSPGVNYPNVQQCIKETSGGEAGQISHAKNQPHGNDCGENHARRRDAKFVELRKNGRHLAIA